MRRLLPTLVYYSKLMIFFVSWSHIDVIKRGRSEKVMFTLSNGPWMCPSQYVLYLCML